MSTAMVIAAREIRERSRLFIVAGALAILPFLVALLPNIRPNAAHAILVFGGAGAFNYACAVAIAMGISAIGRDLSEKRLSFYFSKPLSPAALWIGKAGASLLIAALCALIIAVPSYLAARDAWRVAWRTGGSTLAILLPILIVFFFGISHAVGTITRSRSVLIALDFVLLVATAGVLFLIARPVLFGGGGDVLIGLGVALGGALLVILLIAPVWQLAKGRTDIRRNHRELSKFIWSAVAVTLVVAAAFVMWLRAVEPNELVEVQDIKQSPASGWAVVTGIGAHRGDFHSTFLLNPATNEYTRLDMPLWSDVAWSGDGRVAAWLMPVGLRPQGTFELIVRTVGSKKNVATGIQGRMWTQFALSHDGKRVAIATDRIVSVHDLEHHRLLASVAGSDDFYPRLFFLSDDVLRIVDYPINTQRAKRAILRVSELDVRRRKLTMYGQREVPLQLGSMSISGDGSRMFVRTLAEIVDGRTLATIAKVPATSVPWGATMLDDGSIAIVDRTNGTHLRMFDRDGQPRGEVALPVRSAFVSGATKDGKLIVTGNSAPMMTKAKHSVFIIDRARNVIERTIPDARGPFPHMHNMFFTKGPILGMDGSGKLKVM